MLHCSTRDEQQDETGPSTAVRIILHFPRKGQIENRKEAPPGIRRARSIPVSARSGFGRRHQWRGPAKWLAQPVYRVPDRGSLILYPSRPAGKPPNRNRENFFSPAIGS